VNRKEGGKRRALRAREEFPVRLERHESFILGTNDVGERRSEKKIGEEKNSCTKEKTCDRPVRPRSKEGLWAISTGKAGREETQSQIMRENIRSHPLGAGTLLGRNLTEKGRKEAKVQGRRARGNATIKKKRRIVRTDLSCRKGRKFLLR